MWNKIKEVRNLERQALSNGQSFMLFAPAACLLLLGIFLSDKLFDTKTGDIVFVGLLIVMVLAMNLLIYSAINKKFELDKEAKLAFCLYRSILSVLILSFCIILYFMY